MSSFVSFRPRIVFSHIEILIEQSDADFASCAPYFARAAGVVSTEKTLHTGKGHLAFVEPDPAWLEPLGRWLARPAR